MSDVVVKDGRVQLRDERGAAFSVPEEEAAAALANGGLRPETPEEFETRQTSAERGTLGQRAITVAEGALEGATLGLGTKLATEIGGDEYRQAAFERSEENPGSRLTGNAIGWVAPGLLSGGSGVAGSLARAMPAELLARGGAGLARGVSAGLGRAGLGGAGSGVMGAAANRAIALGAQGAAEGAAYGLGTSLADSSLGDIDWTAERALSGAAEGALYGLAGGAVLGAGSVLIRRGSTAAARAAIDGMVSGGRTLRDAVLNWAEETALAGGSLAAREGDDAARVLWRITKNGDSPERLDRIAERLRGAGVETGSRSEIAAIVSSEASASAARQAELAGALDAGGIRPDGNAIRETLAEAAKAMGGGTRDHLAAARRVRALSKISAPETFADASRLQSRLDDAIDWARESKPAALPDLERLSSKVADQLDKAAADQGAEIGTAWSSVRDELSDWKVLGKNLGRAKLTEPETGKVIGLAGLLGSLAVGNPLPSLAAIGISQSPVARKFVQERGGEALSWLAAHTGWLERTARASAKRLAGGDPLTALQAASGQDRSQQIGKLLTGGKLGAAFQAIQANVMHTNADPTLLMGESERVTRNLAAAQPEVSLAMMRMVADDYQYLGELAKANEQPTPSLQPERSKPVFSPAQQSTLVSAAQALAHPELVLRDLSNGHINWAAINALKARRPGLWGDFRSRVVMECAEQKDALPYARRVMLGTVFEFPSDPSMMPGVVVSTPSDTPNNPSGSARGAPGKLKGASDALGTPNATAIESSEAA